MKRKLKPPRLVRATNADYPTVQNLARFYVYDMSRYCGFISEDWACPKDGLFESFDFKSYFYELGSHAFLIKVSGELAGFALIREINSKSYKIAEFFIIAQFQGYGIAEQAAHEIWRNFKGEWELSVIPENIPALKFWRKAIANFTENNFSEEIIFVDYDKHQPRRYLFALET